VTTTLRDHPTIVEADGKIKEEKYVRTRIVRVGGDPPKYEPAADLGLGLGLGLGREGGPPYHTGIVLSTPVHIGRRERILVADTIVVVATHVTVIATRAWFTFVERSGRTITHTMKAHVTVNTSLMVLPQAWQLPNWVPRLLQR